MYSKEVKQSVIDLRLKRKTYKQISKKTGVSVPSIAIWIRAAKKKHKGLRLIYGKTGRARAA